LGLESLAIGAGAHALKDKAIAIGPGAECGAQGLVPLAPGVSSIAVGANAIATQSVAVGSAALASNGGAAYGDGAAATGSLATALGPNASTTAANAVAIGSGSVANENDIVSVGAPGKERRITNIAAGTAATDAATVGQLVDLRAQIEEVRQECWLPTRTARANGE
jgi:autotransporter adhesin